MHTLWDKKYLLLKQDRLQFNKLGPYDLDLGCNKKNNYQTLDIVQTWGGGSGAAKSFIEKRYEHVLRGKGGQRASSKVGFYKKVCILNLWTVFFCFKLIYMLLNIWTSISHTYPSPIRKNLLFDLSEIDFVFSNFLCQNVQTTVGGGGGPSQVWASKLFASIPAAEVWTMSKVW